MMTDRDGIKKTLDSAMAAHAAGKLDIAKDLYLGVLRDDPNNSDALGWLGSIAAQFRYFEVAEDLLKKAISFDGDNDNFILNYANVLFEKKDYEEALVWYLKISNQRRFDALFHSNLSACYAAIGKAEFALDSAEQSIALNSTDARVWINKGNALSRLNRNQDALRCYTKATELGPELPDGWNAVGICLHDLKRYEDALGYFSRAIDLDPNFSEAIVNYGNSLRGMQRLEESLKFFSRALQIKPDHASVWVYQGLALAGLRRFSEALESYKHSLNIKPDDGGTLCNQANAFAGLGQYEKALVSYEEALKLMPKSADIYYNRGILLGDMGLHNRALESFRKALEINPEFDFLFGLFIMKRLYLCDWLHLDEDLKILEHQIILRKKVVPPFAALVFFDRPELHYIVSKVYSDSIYPENEILGKFDKTHNSSRKKIKLGYFSSDFREHPTAYLTAKLFELHDRENFELYGFSFGPHKDSFIRERIKKSFTSFIDVRGKSDLEIATLSRSLEIDIAIDLGGHTKFARTAIFAYRAAPIQVNYLVYPGTMGSSYYDYIVADKVLVPVDQQEMYSEKIVYLPNSYQANDSFREISDSVLTRSACGLPEKGFVFCCFNNTFKILPEIFRIWVSILRSVDGSVLWLLADDLETKKNVIKAAESLGLDCNRLVFAPFIQHSDHLARLRLADLFLDTFPYNAHTTASDALRAGLPVLTIRGRSFASRVAASLLEAVGLPELIKQNLEDYRSDAIALAKDSERLNQVRAQIMMTVRRSSLFDTKAFTCHFENALTRMWTLYLEGSDPRHIYS